MNNHPRKTSGEEKIVAIHQANYIPWLGYFSKMRQCDVFVYLDTVQYPRGQSFASRNRIKTPNGPAFLTVPISQPDGKHGKALYTDVAFAGQRWKDKHLKSISLNYKKAPYFQEIFSIYESVLRSQDQFLELNIAFIEAIADYLQIDTRRTRLSDILSDFGQKTYLILDICQALSANVYLSGTGGGKAYNDEQLLKTHRIELRYSGFEHPVYPQLWGEFEPHLSILDALFNCGPATKKFLTPQAPNSPNFVGNSSGNSLY